MTAGGEAHKGIIHLSTSHPFLLSLSLSSLSYLSLSLSLTNSNSPSPSFPYQPSLTKCEGSVGDCGSGEASEDIVQASEARLHGGGDGLTPTLTPHVDLPGLGHGGRDVGVVGGCNIDEPVTERNTKT